MNKKINFICILSIILLISVMTIGYSVLNKELSITGEVNYRPQGDMRITNVKQEDINNATIEYFDFSKKEIKLAYRSTGSAFLKFTVEVTNYSNIEMGILKIDGLDGGVVEGYTLGTKLVGEDNNSKAGMTKEFTITYNSSNVETKSLLLKFDFEEVFTISYEGFDDTSNFKKEILRNDKLIQNLGNNPPKKIEVTMDDKVITPNYSNGTLTINQVTGNIKVKSLFYDDSGANAPVLSDGMIPVYYDENDKEWKKADRYNRNNNWCDYNNQKWCNAVTVAQTWVKDLSGNNNNGKIVGPVIENGEAYFDGIDDYIDLGFKNYDFNNQIAFVLRFKFNEIPTKYCELFGNWESAGGGIAYTTDNRFAFTLYNDLLDQYEGVTFPYTVEKNKYYTIVATYNGQSLNMYINGQSVNWNVIMNIRPSEFPIFIGGNPNDGFIGNPSNITVSEAMIFNVDLSEQEIRQHYIDKVTLGETKPLIYYDFEETNREVYKNDKIGTTIPMEEINTMWVWIPRYSYTIKSEDGTNYYGKKETGRMDMPSQALPGEIDVKFIPVSENDSEGSAQYTGNDPNGWFTPPGFTFGDKDLSGIWMGKFEASHIENCVGQNHDTNTGCDLENLKVQIKPQVSTWVFIRVSTLELISMNMTKSKNIYGFDNTYDSHASSNTEWALISYLTQSKYGKYGNTLYSGENKQVYMNNFSGRMTGCSSGKATTEYSYSCLYKYNDLTNNGTGTGYAGAGASSTGNVYGIYDISGETWEYVMGVFNKLSGNTSILNSGYSGKITDGSSLTGRNWPEEKYYNVYTSSNYNIACSDKVCKGHALSETAGWYNDSTSFINESQPWLLRGAGYGDKESAGVFFFHHWEGHANEGITFRVVLTPNN